MAVVHRLLSLQSMALGTWASVAIACGLGSCVVQTLGRLGFSSFGSRALEGWPWHTGLAALRMWNLPRLGIKSVSPAFAGRFLSIVSTTYARLFLDVD